MQAMQGSTWRGRAAGVVFGVLALCGLAAADTICVPDDYETIQEAIDAAVVEGDEICVAPGTYNEAIDFIGKAVRLYSTDGPEVTTIDATGLDASVVKCVSGEGPDTVLEGFTATGGTGTYLPELDAYFGGGMYNGSSSPTVRDCTFDRNTADSGGGMSNLTGSSPTVTSCTFFGNTTLVHGWGGGMYNQGGSPTVMNCTFSGNTAGAGGGMYNSGSSPTVTACTFIGNESNRSGGALYTNGDGSSPTVTNCTFSGNTAGTGGGMHIYGSNPTVTNCTFSGNTANLGGGMYSWYRNRPTVTDCMFIGNEAHDFGGGMLNNNGSSPMVTNCTFTGNEVRYGGGMFNNSASSPTVTNCTFSGNDGGRRGGGMYNDFQSNPTLTNCTFSGNEVLDYGGGVYNHYDTRLVMTNCTFLGNYAPYGRAISCRSGPSDVTLANCILWDGGGEVYNGDNSTIVITYSDVQGDYEGVGNINSDPLCDADGRPQAGSPCIDAGANNAVPADLLDLDEDGDRAERVPVDLDGNHRFMDDGATEDTGCGPIVVDMGAFEFLGEPVHPVLIGDIDLDGTVGADDLIEVLGAWEVCDPACCPADVDFTWEVDFDDLLIVLDNWS